MSNEIQSILTKCVIYARVSSQKQLKEGDGLQSQIHRCQEYAKNKGYKILKVFKEEGVSGSIQDRKAIKELLSFLTKNTKTIVIADNLNRIARDTNIYLTLKNAIEKLDCKFEYLNQSFENTPESRFIETLISATAQLEREGNARQVVQKMKARLEQGFWCFNAPEGYKYGKIGKDKVLIKSDTAVIVQEALIKYSNNELETIADVIDFFAKNGIKKLPNDVKKMIASPIYAGLISYPKWNIQEVIGKHEPTISKSTYEINVEKLLGKKRRYAYDVQNTDVFYLKKVLKCELCNSSLYYSTVKNRHNKMYSHYHCRKKGCTLCNKTYSVKYIENLITQNLKTINFNSGFINILKLSIQEQVESELKNLKNEDKKQKTLIYRLDSDIQAMKTKLINESDEEILSVYKETFKQLKAKKKSLENNQKLNNNPTLKADKLKQTLDNFTNPSQIWLELDNNGKIEMLKLLFKTPIYLNRFNILQTLEKSQLNAALEAVLYEKLDLVDFVSSILNPNNSYELTYA